MPLAPGDATLRQAKPRLYARNGPAALVLRTAGITERDGLYGGNCRAYVMDERDSLDADSPFELDFAEHLLLRR